MPNILDAKKHFQQLYRFDEGFVGVGVGELDGREALRVYVLDAGTPLAQALKQQGTFDGFPVVIETTGKVRAF